jgi:hypothetical protein
MSVPFAAFGPGIAIVTRTDLATPVPVNIGFANELTLDLSGNVKELYGQNQLPIVAARGTIKATGKMKAAVISGDAWNNVFYGQSVVAGGITWVIDENGTIPTTPFQVTVAGSATFDADLGVRYKATGLPLIRVAATPAVGQYTVAAGVYTFNTADSTLVVLITYSKTAAAGGEILAVSNALIGTTPTFQLDYYTVLNQPSAKTFIVRVYACIGAKHAMTFKLEDFMMPEFDFQFFALANGKVIDYNYPELS